MTKYDYKLSTFTVDDAEYVSRTVLFQLTLIERERGEGYNFLMTWHGVFGIQIPVVVFTNGCEAMRDFSIFLQKSESNSHLTCIFHLSMKISERKCKEGFGPCFFRLERCSEMICSFVEKFIVKLIWNIVGIIYLGNGFETSRNQKKY